MESIRALSVQGKGRIERLWKTFQDRLGSELRLAQAKTLKEANTVLQRYMVEHNRRFSVAPKEAGNDFGPVSKKVNRDRLFSLKYERVVGKDHVIALGARSIQWPAKQGKFGYAGAKVELVRP